MRMIILNIVKDIMFNKSHNIENTFKYFFSNANCEARFSFLIHFTVVIFNLMIWTNYSCIIFSLKYLPGSVYWQLHFNTSLVDKFVRSILIGTLKTQLCCTTIYCSTPSIESIFISVVLHFRYVYYIQLITLRKCAVH